jgi:hypothetical protein
MSFSFAITSTAVKPNDAPDMELGDKRTFAFKLHAGLGTISSAVWSGDNLTIGSRTTSGVNTSAPVTASSLGTHALKVTATLASGDILVRVVRVNVIDSTQDTGSRDYE